MIKTSKITKILAALMLVIMLVTFTTNIVMADFDASTVLDKMENNSNGNLDDDFLAKAGKIMGLIRNIAVIVGVIILMVIGVKFMLGSAEEKAEYKKSLMPLVVGIVIVMAAAQIVTMVFDFMK